MRIFQLQDYSKLFQKHNSREIQNKNTGKGIAEALERSGGNIYEWDSRHGRVGNIIKGKHLGSLILRLANRLTRLTLIRSGAIDSDTF